MGAGSNEGRGKGVNSAANAGDGDPLAPAVAYLLAQRKIGNRESQSHDKLNKHEGREKR